MPRRANRRDGTQPEIVQAFEQLGCTVVDLSGVGIAGLPDLAVGAVGVTHLVEVKDRATAYGRKGLSSGQSAFARDWRGGRVWVVHDALEAAALVQNWRRP